MKLVPHSKDEVTDPSVVHGPITSSKADEYDYFSKIQRMQAIVSGGN